MQGVSFILAVVTSLCFASLHCIEAEAQTSSDVPGVMLKNEYSYYGVAHSQGLGIGFRWGRQQTALKKSMFEVEFLNMKHPKEIRSSNNAYYESARSFVYGKKNFFMLLRTGIGSQRIFNEKPYWGGVEVRRYFAFGASLGITKPVYLYIIVPSNIPVFYTDLELYDPEQHDLTNIYGRGPFFKGFDHLKFYPGIYAKYGLSFEYSSERAFVKAIEIGVSADLYLSKIPIMAYNTNNQYDLTFYLAFHIGRRFNPGQQ